MCCHNQVARILQLASADLTVVQSIDYITVFDTFCPPE